MTQINSTGSKLPANATQVTLIYRWMRNWGLFLGAFALITGIVWMPYHPTEIHKLIHILAGGMSIIFLLYSLLAYLIEHYIFRRYR